VLAESRGVSEGTSLSGGSPPREGAHAEAGVDCAARHERSSDWRRGAAGSPDPDIVLLGGAFDSWLGLFFGVDRFDG
jgi:hypothetical protein